MKTEMTMIPVDASTDIDTLLAQHTQTSGMYSDAWLSGFIEAQNNSYRDARRALRDMRRRAAQESGEGMLIRVSYFRFSGDELPACIGDAKGWRAALNMARDMRHRGWSRRGLLIADARLCDAIDAFVGDEDYYEAGY